MLQPFQPTKCRICNGPSDGLHFGVEACRACAAFFRRTVVLNLKYHCRYMGKCVLDKDSKNMCRSCRQAKCYEIGMKPEGVQQEPGRPRVLKMVQKYENPNSMECDSTEAIVEAPPSVENIESAFRKNGFLRDMFFNRINTIFEQVRYSPRAYSGTILERMLIAYKQLVNKRCFLHTDAMLDFDDLWLNQDELENRVEYDYSVFMRMIKNDIDLVAEMVATFDSFLYLSADQRWALFRHFYAHFMKVERAYDTIQRLGLELKDDRLLLYNGFPIKLDSIERLSKTTRSGKVAEMLKLYIPATHLVLNNILRPMKNMNPTGIEFMAIIGHLLWQDPGDVKLSDETIAIAANARKQIFTDLHFYYVNRLQLHEYATRISEFMVLLMASEKIVAQRREDIMVANLFNICKIDENLQEIFLSETTRL